MIEIFIFSWALFHQSYLTGWLDLPRVGKPHHPDRLPQSSRIGEIHRLLSSSIIGATMSTVVFLSVFCRKLLLFSLDQSMAMATGLKTTGD